MKHAVPVQRLASCGDTSCEFLIDPIPRPRPAPFAVRMRPERAEVVFIANQKPNALQVLERAQAILRARGVRVRDEIYRKTAGGAVQGELLEQLKKERGLVLSGVND